MNPRFSRIRRRLRPIATSILLGLSIASAGSASAQSDEPAAGTGASAPEARPPLLREGSHMLRVVGRMQRDRTGSAWIFIIDAEDDQMPGHELTMMPCSLLDEMDRMIESAPDYQLVFETTGQVFVHENRNYLMLSHPPLLIGHETPPAAAPADEGEPGRDTVQDIVRDLERSVGPVGRRPEAEPSTTAEDAPGARRDLVREGTVLLSRRGKIRRASGGAYQFVFDADAEGLADPPMTILPCLLLQRLERYARQAGEDATVLISGHVYAYRKQNYLLPMTYRVPRERTILHP